jgi:hypothetical protein
MKFSEHENYMNLSHEYDMLWMDLLTPNGGFVKRPDKHGKERKNGISMFHQLHCLGMMREAVQDLTERLATAESGMPMSSRRAAAGGAHGLHDPTAEPDHWLHCFDYLRQVSFHSFGFCFLVVPVDSNHVNRRFSATQTRRLSRRR